MTHSTKVLIFHVPAGGGHKAAARAIAEAGEARGLRCEVIDALELCYAREHINTYVIASGDSDFVPLAAKLRENDRYVIGIGVKQATSPMFVKACDEFMYLEGSSRDRERDRVREPALSRLHRLRPHPGLQFDPHRIARRNAKSS